MEITEAKQLIGKICSVTWLDRRGCELNTISKIHDVTFVPLYGGHLITDTEDVRLDKIIAVHILAETGKTIAIDHIEETGLLRAA